MSRKPLVWFVTGCSSGFGEQFVHQILARGDKVIATGRNAATKLQPLEGTGAAILDLDVSSKPDVINKKIKEAIEIYGHIDIVVNNAGYIESASVEELGDERLRRSFETNFFGPVSIARAVLPHMRERETGTIAWIGSVAGLKGDPSAAAYSSAKHALAGLVACLALEMAMFGLKCILLEPGYFRTNALKQGNLKHEPGFVPAYEQFNQSVIQFETAVYGSELGDPTKGVARMIDVITSSGTAAGKVFPLHVPLGSDGFKTLRDRAESDLKICNDWEATLKTTDIAP